MKSSTSCRVCRHWLEGDWNRLHSLRRVDRLTEAVQEKLDALQRQMDQGHCDGCPPIVGPRIWPTREELMNRPKLTQGRTLEPFTLDLARPSLIGYRDLAVIVWAEHRRVEISGQANALWSIEGNRAHVTVEGRLQSTGALCWHAFSVTAVLDDEPRTGTHAAHSLILPAAQWARRQGGKRSGPCAVTVSLASLGRPPVQVETIPW